MYQIAVFCEIPSDDVSVAEVVASHHQLPVLVSKQPDELVQLLASKVIHLLIFETVQFNTQQLNLIREVRSRGFSAPVMVVARHFQCEEKAMDKQKIIRLERPFELKELLGITRKLLFFGETAQRHHRRYPTIEKARLECTDDGSSFEGSILNISQSGAYCECSNAHARLGLGDLVKLSVDLEDTKRGYSVYAKVVWATRQSTSLGGPGYGLQFLKPNEVYSNLAKK